VEAQYQDEFYRACYSLLGNIYLSSEWSGKEKSGRVDFLLKSQRWAIECVRDGNRLEEHISRFKVGGKYHRWIDSGEIQEYILLDFRQSLPWKIKGIVEALFLLRVIHADSLILYVHSLLLAGVPFKIRLLRYLNTLSFYPPVIQKSPPQYREYLGGKYMKNEKR